MYWGIKGERMKFCQGPECHMHKTKDRIKGTKGSKTIKPEEEVNSIMVMAISVQLIARRNGLTNLAIKLLTTLEEQQ